jgi:carboxymethylenebutenolidase
METRTRRLKLAGLSLAALAALAVPAALAQQQTGDIKDPGLAKPNPEAASRVVNAPLVLPAASKAGMVEGLIKIKSFDQDITAYRAYPQGKLKNAPVIVFLPMIVGTCSALHQDFALRLAREGYYVIMPNLNERKHGMNACSDPFWTIVRDNIAFPNEAQYLLDIRAAFDHAAKEGASATKRGMVGYDGGARVTMKTLTREPSILAGVAYSGPVGATPLGILPGTTEAHPTPIELLNGINGVKGGMQGKLLAIFGDKEGQIPPEHIAEFQAAQAKVDPKSKTTIYPGRHGFIVDFDTTDSSKKAWAEGLAWLRSHGVR